MQAGVGCMTERNIYPQHFSWAVESKPCLLEEGHIIDFGVSFSSSMTVAAGEEGEARHPQSTKRALSTTMMTMPQHRIGNPSRGGSTMLTNNDQPPISNLRFESSQQIDKDCNSTSVSAVQCARHPSVRMKIASNNINRCPICAVASGASTVTEAIFSHEFNENGDFGRVDEIVVVDHKVCDASTVCSGNGDELEEVSLDPKWAEALRAISIRLASERAQESMSTVKSESHLGSVIKSQSPVDMSEKTIAENDTTPRIPIITDLQRTIQLVTRSLGKFSTDIECDEYDEDVSLSSFASDAHFVPKNFAESKRQIPFRGSLRSHQLDDPAPWLHGFEFYPSRKSYGFNARVAREDNNIGSDSSVTSSLTCESYNSLGAPVNPFRGTSSKKLFENMCFSREENFDSLHSEEFCCDANDVAMLERNIEESLLKTSLSCSKLDSMLGPTEQKRAIGTLTNTSDTLRNSSKKENINSFNNAQEVIDAGIIEETNIAHTGATRSLPEKDKILEVPRMYVMSFLKALGRNSRSRSRSRPSQSRSKSFTRSSSHRRSKSRNRSKSRKRSKSPRRSQSPRRSKPGPSNQVPGLSEPTEPWYSVTVDDERHMHEESCVLSKISVTPQAELGVEESEFHPDIVQAPRNPLVVAPAQPGSRSPIAHPHYKLGDTACDDDMIVIPTSRQRRGRTRNREVNDESAETLHSSSCSDDVEKEVDGSIACERFVDINRAIGQLRHLDAAFIRRSDGSWTYALVADGNENEIRFVVDDRGCTKVVPKSLWRSHVRRIKVLTQRQGDRVPSIYQTNSEVQTRGMRQSFRGREKGRLTSPSPIRWKSCPLNLPATIKE